MPSPAVSALLDRAFSEPARFGQTLAVVVVAGDGRPLVEAYCSEVGADSLLISWSMAKSFTHLAAGIAGIDPADTMLFPEWADDARGSISLGHCLCMVDGLAWAEDYVDAQASDVIEMLFGSGADDVVGYARRRPAEFAPGTRWRYSSGTTNLLADVVRRTAGVERGDDWRAWLIERVCRPAGMSSAEPRLDAAGSFVASSFLYATALDFARFGLVYLHGGDGLVESGWITSARRPTAGVDEPGRGYGQQWWLWPDRPDWLVAQGYETQRTIVAFDRELVVVRLGKTPAALGGEHVDQWLLELVDAL